MKHCLTEPLQLRAFVATSTLPNTDDLVPLYLGDDRTKPIGTARLQIENGRSVVVATLHERVCELEMPHSLPMSGG
jgi:hypothetical protein